MEHPLGENVLDGDEVVFDLREFGAPGGAVGSPDAVDQMFGDAVQVGADFVDGGGGGFGECYPWHLIGVGANGECEFRAAVYQIMQLSCKPCTAPTSRTCENWD